MGNFKETLYGAIQILINPNYIREKVGRIHDTMDLPTGIAIVSKSVFNELDKIGVEYPTDLELHKRITELKMEVPEDKEELKQLISQKQELEKLAKKFCETCQQPYLFKCVHAPIHEKKVQD